MKQHYGGGEDAFAAMQEAQVKGTEMGGLALETADEASARIAGEGEQVATGRQEEVGQMETAAAAIEKIKGDLAESLATLAPLPQEKVPATHEGVPLSGVEAQDPIDIIMNKPETLDNRIRMMRAAGLTDTAQFDAMVAVWSADSDQHRWNEGLSLRNESVRLGLFASPFAAAGTFLGATAAGVAAAPLLASLGLSFGALALGGYGVKKVGNWWLGRKADRAARDAGLIDGKGKFWQSK